MLKNFFKTTIRTLLKNKTYSFLNIFGLATGIACAGLIFLWVEDEVNYDSVHVKKDRIYALANNQDFGGKIFTFTGVSSNATPGLLADAVKTEIPGIVNAGRVSWNTRSLFTLADKSVYESGFYIDSSLFNMLTFNFVEGSPKTAFNQLYSIVITEKMAKHFFGDEKNVIGKTLKADNDQNYTVSGVIKEMPENSSLRFDWVASFEIFFKQHQWLTGWGANSINTFVELSPSANVAAVNKQLYGFIQKKQATATAHLFLFSMNDWRLRSEFTDGKQSGGRIEYIHMFSAIAWIILLIACINFMNLATARSEKRAKEVGVRKVMGAVKGLLVAQFIGEAVCMAVIAAVLSVIIIILVLPLFNTLVQKQLTPGLANPLHIALLVGITLISGLVAGSYPALYLSSFNPIYVFKGIKLKSGGASIVRKGLVVLQFTASIVLIISTIIIYQQIQHIKSRDMGYDRTHLLTIPVRGDMVKNYDAIKQGLLASGVVENAALNSMNTLYRGNNGSIKILSWPGKNPNLDVLVSFRQVSPGFIATAGMHMKEGHDFTDVKADSNNILITESFAKLMGKGSPLGTVISGNGYRLTVIGVVKDYVYDDMYGSPDPVIFGCAPANASLMYVRIKPGVQNSQALARLEAIMKRYNPGYPFEYSFVDDEFNNLFSSEMLIGQLSRIFATLAIIISCLGLFGLSAYTAERKTKEIGIRKVLGANVTGITALLSKEFIQLVLLSSFIAFPFAWWAMHNWLQTYAYRVSISWWVFALAAVSAVLIALVTISYQAIKTAMMNPVKAIRAE
ncbi:MAG TPA: ABC transporter permease [Chitinophagaceae bacterium]|nr:ABC transporter permease [Chitinophagaceae bacterium]